VGMLWTSQRNVLRASSYTIEKRETHASLGEVNCGVKCCVGIVGARAQSTRVAVVTVSQAMRLGKCLNK
jgi:hypothetical protein